MSIDIHNFKAKLSKFTNTIYCLQQDLTINPANDHVSMTIDYFQIMQKRTQFMTALFNTIIRFVYNDAEQHDFVTKMGTDAEESDSWLYLLQDCKDKFRTGNLKGQFSELLLYNMLIHLYGAIPAVRKMKLTTNPKLERNGADAIHVAYNEKDSQYEIYIGEAKTYTSSFKKALHSAIGSIEKAYFEHNDELNLYRTPGFLEEKVKDVVVNYMDGHLPLKTNLIAIVTYCCGDEKGGDSRDKILKAYMDDVEENCKSFGSKSYPQIDKRVFDKITYIFFPVNELQNLIDTFTLKFN